MAVFAIGDLHLPGHSDKPMDIFGDRWEHHFDTISGNWKAKVAAEDIVLIPGDISWAMQLGDARDDLNAIAALPGKKVLLRGNHDYWWSSPAKIRNILPPDMFIVQNDAVPLGPYVFCGTRGWLFPAEDGSLSEEDRKIYDRELIRLRMSLMAAQKYPQLEAIAMLHFPPLATEDEDTGFTRLLEEFGIRKAVYGHVHGAAIRNAFSGMKNGVHYQLVSCDSLQFSPLALG